MRDDPVPLTTLGLLATVLRKGPPAELPPKTPCPPRAPKEMRRTAPR